MRMMRRRSMWWMTCWSSSTMDWLRTKPTMRAMPMTRKRMAPMIFTTKLMVKCRILERFFVDDCFL